MDSTFLVPLLALVLFVAVLRAKTKTKVCDLPDTGHTYVASVKNFFRVGEGVRGGCAQFGDRLFIFPILGHDVVVGKSKSFVQDICNALEDELSMEAMSEEMIQFNHVVGPPLTDEVDHFHAVKMTLNKNLGSIIAPLLDEMSHACERYVSKYVADDDPSWVPMEGLDIFSRILSSMCNRIFVGESLCRRDDYITLTARLSDNVILNGLIFRTIVPTFLRRHAGRIFQWVLGYRRRMGKFLQPLIEERKRRRSANENPENDMLSWMMGDENPSTAALTMALININFLALHTTSKVFTNVFLRLASDPSYISPLREEIERYLDPTNVGMWSIAALSRCVNLDSFFKESMRLDSLGALWLPRMALKEFTFSDGTTIPAGTFLGVALSAVHEDEAVYENGRSFDGFRFSKLYEQDPAEDSRWMYRMTSPAQSYLAFGKGHHLCPGRFFAAAAMKFLTAYLLMNYDVKMEVDDTRPGRTAVGPSAGPPRKTRILFRRRQH